MHIDNRYSAISIKKCAISIKKFLPNFFSAYLCKSCLVYQSTNTNFLRSNQEQNRIEYDRINIFGFKFDTISIFEFDSNIKSGTYLFCLKYLVFDLNLTNIHVSIIYLDIFQVIFGFDSFSFLRYSRNYCSEKDSCINKYTESS